MQNEGDIMILALKIVSIVSYILVFVGIAISVRKNKFPF